MNSKLLYLEGALFFLIGGLTPVGAILASEVSLSNRTTAAMIVSGIIGGSTALKAYLSTKFASTTANGTTTTSVATPGGSGTLTAPPPVEPPPAVTPVPVVVVPAPTT